MAPVTYSPAGQVIDRIGEFQTFVISLTDRQVIPGTTGRSIVKWTVASINVIRATPDGVA
jgi:hypothetical protein